MKGSDRQRAVRHRPSVSDSCSRSVGSRPSSRASQIIRSDIRGPISGPSSCGAARPAAFECWRRAIDRRARGAAYLAMSSPADPRIAAELIKKTAASKAHTAANTAATAPQ